MKHPYRNAVHASASVLLMAVVAGCSSSDSDPAPATDPETPGGNPGTTPGTTPGGTPETPDMPAMAELDGEWLRSCLINEREGMPTTYDTVALTIDGATATSSQLNYTDADCTTPATPGEVVIDVTIAVAEGATETDRGSATHVDITPVSVTRDGVAPTEEQRETVASRGGFDTTYDIAVVADGALYFGDLSSDAERDGAAPERRPATLESVPYVRQ